MAAGFDGPVVAKAGFGADHRDAEFFESLLAVVGLDCRDDAAHVFHHLGKIDQRF